MGIYSNNRTNLSEFEGVAREGYHDEVGINKIIIENHQNDMAVFEAVLKSDFAEAIALQEGYMTESQIEALSEATMSNLWGKIREFFKNLIEKIKGIFKSFLAKLNGVIMRDNKELVKKYYDEVRKKTFGDNFKYKAREPKGPVDIDIEKLKDKISTNISSDEATLVELQKATDDGEYTKTMIKDIASVSCELSELKTELMNKWFEDEDEHEGLSSSELNQIVETLENSKKEISAVESQQKKMISAINTIIKNLGKAENAANTAYKNDEKKKVAAMQAKLVYDRAKDVQSIVLVVASATIDAIKLNVKQCRAIFVKAAAYNPKSESALFESVAVEASDYEMDSWFEDYTFA